MVLSQRLKELNTNIASNSHLGTQDLNILLLEDYDLDAALVTKAIQTDHPNWKVHHVATKDQFEEALEHENPDVILSDYALPQFNGMEAFLTVKELGLSVPFIIITGDLPEDQVVKCIYEGVDDYVIKSSLARISLSIQNAIIKHEQAEKEKAMSDQLAASESRYEALFNRAGAAICELIIPNHKEIIQKRLEWNKATWEEFLPFVQDFKIQNLNEEMVALFDGDDSQNVADNFSNLWSSEETGALRFIFRQLASSSGSFTEKLHFSALTRGSLFLKAKFNLVAPSEGKYILSLIDLTDVKRSENRLYRIVEQMESVVKHRTEEMNVLNQQLKVQAREREKISEMMRDNYIHMTEGIIAAKRIQQLILPSKQHVAAKFSDMFIYLRPKDIVSGDFYWHFEMDNKVWLAAVDCTGHGVPGAFMSMVGSNVLNQAVLSDPTLSTSELLHRADDLIIRELRQHESTTEISTGMDISICSFDLDTKEMRFSGAFQNVYHRSGDELHEIRGDRWSIGGTFIHEGKSFSEHVIQLQEGDRIYMSSDGFYDQFGGPKIKKFMRKRFIDLLTNLKGESMYDQEVEIKSAFQDWKGTCEQVDDILVIGVKV